MPATFFVFLILQILVVATVLLAIILLIVSLIWKKPKGTYRRLGCMMSLPSLSLGVFFFSIMIYDALVAGLTNTFPNFSDYEQAGIAKHFTLCPGELRNGHTKELLVGVNSLYIDEDDAVIVSSKTAPEKIFPEDKGLVYLYRFEYKDNQCKQELLDSDKDETLLWDRYVAAHSIDRAEVMTTMDKLMSLIWWHLPLNAFLALLTAFFAVYGAWRIGIKKKKNSENLTEK